LFIDIWNNLQVIDLEILMNLDIHRNRDGIFTQNIECQLKEHLSLHDIIYMCATDERRGFISINRRGKIMVFDVWQIDQYGKLSITLIIQFKG
jgi:hypothetical protein